MSPDIAQIKKSQAEAGLLRPRQAADEEIGDLLVLVVQLGAVTIAGLTDIEGTAGKRKANPRATPRLAQPSPRLAQPSLGRQANARICRKAPDGRIAAPLSPTSFPQKLALHANPGIPLPQPMVLILQSLPLADHRRAHAALFGSRLV